MSNIKIEAGDFNPFAPASFSFGTFSLIPKTDTTAIEQATQEAIDSGAGFFKQMTAGFKAAAKSTQTVKVSYSKDDIEAIELASEDAVKRIGGTVGWGIAGSVLLGPAGLLAGLLLGGKSKKITFVCKFKDSRKLLATTDKKTWLKIQKAMF